MLHRNGARVAEWLEHASVWTLSAPKHVNHWFDPRLRHSLLHVIPLSLALIPVSLHCLVQLTYPKRGCTRALLAVYYERELTYQRWKQQMYYPLFLMTLLTCLWLLSNCCDCVKETYISKSATVGSNSGAEVTRAGESDLILLLVTRVDWEKYGGCEMNFETIQEVWQRC